MSTNFYSFTVSINSFNFFTKTHFPIPINQRLTWWHALRHVGHSRVWRIRVEWRLLRTASRHRLLSLIPRRRGLRYWRIRSSRSHVSRHARGAHGGSAGARRLRRAGHGVDAGGAAGTAGGIIHTRVGRLKRRRIADGSARSAAAHGSGAGITGDPRRRTHRRRRGAGGRSLGFLLSSLRRGSLGADPLHGRRRHHAAWWHSRRDARWHAWKDKKGKKLDE